MGSPLPCPLTTAALTDFSRGAAASRRHGLAGRRGELPEVLSWCHSDGPERIRRTGDQAVMFKRVLGPAAPPPVFQPSWGPVTATIWVFVIYFGTVFAVFV